MIPCTRIDNESIVAYLIRTSPTCSITAQACATNLSPLTIRAYRSRLVRAGLLQRRYQYWTTREDDEMICGVRDGLTLLLVARHRCVSRDIQRVIHRVWRRHGGIRRVRTGVSAQLGLNAVRTGRQVAELLGIAPRIVYWLCENGAWVYGRRGYTQPKKRGKNWHYLITDDQLMQFMARREYWMLYDPQRITDPDWRDHALLCRREEPGRWLTTKEIALKLGYTPSTIKQWCLKGLVDALNVRGRWFIWSGSSKTQALIHAKTTADKAMALLGDGIIDCHEDLF